MTDVDSNSEAGRGERGESEQKGKKREERRKGVKEGRMVTG